MPKRRVHEVSDSDDSDNDAKKKRIPSRATKSVIKNDATNNMISDDEDAVEEASMRSAEASTGETTEQQRAVAVTTLPSSQSQSSLMCLDTDDDVERTPRSFRVIDAPKRASRKLQFLMFGYVLDRSPSAYGGLNDYASEILKRKVIDTFMRMRLDKYKKHHVVVMSCCDKNTDNFSNRAQPKQLNEHCVEILPTGELAVEQIRALSKTAAVTPEEEQFSNVIAGLMTAADLIARTAAELEPYESTELTLFSDLIFDSEEPSFKKMSRVLSMALPDTNLTVISNENVINSEAHESNLEFLKNIFAQVEVLSYERAFNLSEQWTMAEQIPTKYNASIKIFDQEVPTESYLVCNEKNVSLLKTRLEKVNGENSSSNQCLEVPESALREEKKLVKLTHDGHYMKGDDDRLVSVDPERSTMAFKFGATAVPTDKKLTDYINSTPNHKGYLVKGWYPAHEFALHVSGGKAYRVFPGTQNCSVFDSLLMLCARKGFALLVDYTYQARFDPKPGVLIPHHKKRCFVFYELVHEDNLNYLPRYDPITSVKPPAEKVRKMCDIIAASRLSNLELKYDPQAQQIIENCWSSKLGGNECKHQEKFSAVEFKAKTALHDEIEDFKESAEGFVRKLTVKKNRAASEADNDDNDDRILFNVERLDDDQIIKLKTSEFGSLFKR